jgi:hypothetical protein
MKIFYLIIVLFALFFIGCSTTYKISDFSSKDKFFEDFNNSANNKKLKVILNNDSSFICESGAQISNDSLAFTEKVLPEENILSSGKVKKIEYISYADNSGNIILNNGNIIFGESIKVISDSAIQFISYRKMNKQISIINIKEVICNQRWLGAWIDFLIGIPSGFIIDLLVTSFIKNHTQGEAETVNHVSSDILIGVPIVSGIVGYITGYTYIYQFNP